MPDSDFAPALAQLVNQPAVTVANTGTGMKDIQNNGVTVDVAARSKLNIIAGTGIALTIADDAANDRVNVTIAGGARGSSLPVSPVDGDEYNYVADATNGIIWLFKYNAGSASAYKWEFLGGSPLVSYTPNVETIPNNGLASFSALTTVVSVVAPRAGDYEVYSNAQQVDFSAGGGTVIQQLQVNGVLTGDAHNFSIGLNRLPDILEQRLLGIAASATIRQSYASNTTGNTAGYRRLRIFPVRIS